jgi:hypothetical protein
VATPTLAALHASDAKRRGIIGPVGSSKSTAMCMEIMRRAHEMPPDKDGVRWSRWMVVRNTYRELKDTTLNTWLEWFPESRVGLFNYSDMAHRIRLALGDGTSVHLEVMFRSFDKPRDIGKALSLDITGAWINEAREIPKFIVDAIDDRIGRYNPGGLPKGSFWHGLIMDSNPPDEDHWWFKLAEETKPEDRPGWEFFRQPGGLVEVAGEKFEPNPLAENIDHLPLDYYRDKAVGKSLDHIRVYYCARYGFVQDGKPVFPEYRDEMHCAKAPLEPVPGLPLLLGQDFGLTPAAVIGQRLANGRIQIIDEMVAQDMGIQRFGQDLLPLLHTRYPVYELLYFGDPAGDQRAQTDETTPFQILRALGLPIRPAPSNDFTLRREAVAGLLNRLVDGKPGLLISPTCKNLRKALAGGYAYKRVQVSGAERYQDKPDKGPYSHVADALQYLCIGAGEGRALLKRPDDGKPRQRRGEQGRHGGQHGQRRGDADGLLHRDLHARARCARLRTA